MNTVEILQMLKRYFFLAFIVFFVSGCTAYQVAKWTDTYGPSNAQNRNQQPYETASVEYWSDVKPILDKRCVVCHACYDAPCQLKLTAPEGIERGAISKSPYDTRITPGKPSRLFQDHLSSEQWRAFGFHPVLNEHTQTPEINKKASPMFRLLEQKEHAPLILNNQRLSKEFTLNLNRKQSCPKPVEIEKHITGNPFWGMPYALPGLQTAEQNTLKTWIEEGGKYAFRLPDLSGYTKDISTWELFFNRDDLKTQLMSRYIYEHLFLANIYFSEGDSRQFFKMVRSSTPPGTAVEAIYTRRPYDDPKTKRIYYRLIPHRESIVSKTHMPYLLDEKRLKRWQELFIDAEYNVDALPSFKVEIASNPFRSFQAIPANSRYKFLLDEAQFTIMNFIKGPVCRGQLALNVIRDHFWVFFVNPDALDNAAVSDFLIDNYEAFELPTKTKTSYTPLAVWREYSNKERKLLKAKDKFIEENLSAKNKINLGLVWDGGGVNQNAALTVFRHHDNATVEKGLIGHTPKTAWVINYSLLERIHYLLVAGFDIYGNVGHQLLSRLYMDFLRIEGESNFILLLPSSIRQNILDDWYVGTPKSCRNFLKNTIFAKDRGSSITYTSNNYQSELYAMLKVKLENVLSVRRELKFENAGLNFHFSRLSEHAGESTRHLPEITYVRVELRNGKKKYLTLLKNNEHSNITSLFKEEEQLTPEDNTLTVAHGILGSYPNALITVKENEVPILVDQLTSILSDKDFSKVMTRFGVRRTHPDFWDYSDKLHQAFREENEIEYGVIDYNRLGNF